MDLIEKWKQFFCDAGIAASKAATYADNFTHNEIQPHMLKDLNKEYLKDMGITSIGDVIAILGHSKHVYEEEKETKRTCLRPENIMKNIFESIIDKPSFVDKTLFINDVIKLFNASAESLKNRKFPVSDPTLFTAPRRFGKTTNFNMVKAFFDGSVPREKFNKLKIGNNKIAPDAMQWYGQFEVIFVSFGHFTCKIESVKRCIDACREIVSEAFRDHSYIRDSLNEQDRLDFGNWICSEKCSQMSDERVGGGLNKLVEFMNYYLRKEKPCILMIDEFDSIFLSALSALVDCQTLKDIVSFYSRMVARALKFSNSCYGLLTGISRISSVDSSSLNNIRHINFLNNDSFVDYYGVFIEEFDDLMKRSTTPKEVIQQKELAREWYNGYNYKDKYLLNTYSVACFFESKKVEAYWKSSGTAEGLIRALEVVPFRKDIVKLVSEELIVMKYVLSLPAEACTPDNVDFTMNFLLQQGYLTVEKELADGMVCVKIPNKEVLIYLKEQMELHFKAIFYNPILMRKCNDCFMNMNILDEDDCLQKLKIVKSTLNELFSKTKKSKLNEAWLESFLFSVFLGCFEIKQQSKIPETAKNNDLRTAKILDLFIKGKDRCFVFEESLIDNAEKTLKKLLDKEYFIEAVNTGLPYVLISISVGEDTLGFVNFSMMYLRNVNSGNGTEL